MAPHPRCHRRRSRGFGNREIIAAFGVAAIAFAVFLIAQTRGRHPMVPLSLFRSRTVSVTLMVALTTMMGFYGVVCLQSLYVQQLRDESALHTGLLFLPMTALVALLNPLAALHGLRISLLATAVVLAVTAAATNLAPPEHRPTR